MATDRSLTTLLRALQRPTGEEDASRLLGSATTLLTLLSNPLNLTLLSSQLLTAPAVWKTPDGLQIPLRVLSVVNTASLQLVRNEADTHQGRFTHPARDGLDRVEWARAVARGADDKSPKWKHLLILGGLLVGFEGHERRGLPRDLRRTLEASVVDAANEALLDEGGVHEMAAGSIVLVLGHVLSLLEDHLKLRLRHDLLLPILSKHIFYSNDGLQSGYFLGIADKDIMQIHGSQFNWSAKSTSFYLLQKLAKGPLVGALGSMSQLMALCMERVSDVRLLIHTVDEIANFSRSLAVQWRQNKLSEVDRSEEAEFLDQETRNSTLPVLWQILRSTMFAIVVVQRSLMGRLLADRSIPMEKHPYIAVQTLHILRNIYFISSRLGHNSFSQYTFLYMTAIDVLSNYPTQAEAFLTECRPKTSTATTTPRGSVPEHPHDRSQDLFFFNTAEHFTLVLTPAANESLLLDAAQPYLGTGGDGRLMEMFEAAHSVMLAVLSAPQNHAIAARRLPDYVGTVVASFPATLSPRQFRLAARTLVRVASPPNALSEARPLLASAVLELLHERFRHASEAALLPPPGSAAPPSGLEEPLLSEKAVMLLTIIDSLPVLSLAALEEWLPIAAGLVKHVGDGAMRDRCRNRLWEVLSNGDMDVPRAELCVAWWNTQGGRDEVLGYAPPPQKQEYLMSGAMQEQSKL